MFQTSITFDDNLITQSRHKQLMNVLLRREMEKHRDQTLPKHFELGANTKYNYQPLKRGYAIMKARVKKHQIPMVFTGRMKQAVLSTSKVTATATRSRLYAKNYFPMKDYFREQVETVLPSETKTMADNIARNYTMLVNTTVWGRKRAKRKSP